MGKKSMRPEVPSRMTRANALPPTDRQVDR